MGSGNSGLYASTSSEVHSLPDSYPGDSFSIGRSLSAAAKNYRIRDPESGKLYKFAEGTTISGVETFAGKGTRNKLKQSVVTGLSERYGGKMKDWKHSKGIGTIDKGGRFQSAEVHWFENGERKVGFKIKEWL